jgi:hypothetical protein
MRNPALVVAQTSIEVTISAAKAAKKGPASSELIGTDAGSSHNYVWKIDVRRK